MAIYGKISAHGVNVSETSKDLQNTGVKSQLGSIITIDNLLANEQYCFACGAYNGNDELSGAIGLTGENIKTLHPLPINLLYSYLAKIAYQIGDFETSKIASEKACWHFCEFSEITERLLNYKKNPIFIWRLKQQTLHDVSIIELYNLAETFIILARCVRIQQKEEEERLGNQLMPIQKQINILNVCNFLLLSVETALAVNNDTQAKRTILEIYNTVIPFLGQTQRTKFLFQILLKAQMLATRLPKELWTHQLRTISCKIDFEIVIICFQYNEFLLSKRILFGERSLPKRCWVAESKMIMVQQEDPNKDDKKKMKAAIQPKKGGKQVPTLGKQIQATEEEDPIKEVPKLIREIKERPSLQGYLEETLFSFSEEYSEFISVYLDNARDNLDNLANYIENGVDIAQRIKQEIVVKFEFWEIVTKDFQQAFTRIQTTYKQHPCYLEFMCKLIRRQLELQVDQKQVLAQFSQIEEIDNDLVKLINQIKELKYYAIKSNIEWYPDGLEELISDRETNKVGEDTAIDLFTKYRAIEEQFQTLIQQNSQNRPVYAYQCLWKSEFYLLKAMTQYQIKMQKYQNTVETEVNVLFDINKMDQEKFQTSFNDYKIMESHEEKESTKEFLSIFQSILSDIVNATYYALHAKAWTQFQNIIKLLSNIMETEMVSPFMHSKSEEWIQLTFIAQNITKALEIIKKFGFAQEMYIPFQFPEGSEYFLDKIKTELQFEENKQLSLEEEKQQEIPAIDAKLTNEIWFLKKKNVDVYAFSNIIAYTVHSLAVHQQWNLLISVTRNFSNATSHYFGNKLLPFTLNAKIIKLTEATKSTNDRKEALRKRTAEFEKWKEKNKKKKSRQLQFLGEISPEEQKFNEDAEELQKQIALCKDKENKLRIKKERTEKVLTEITRDANQALLDLWNQRKMLEEQGIIEAKLNFEETIGIDIKRKRQINRQVIPSIILKYKEIIQILEKRQERFAKIQALKECGNLNFCIKNIEQAKELWIESLDTIFQEIHSMQTWREFFPKKQILAQNVGSQQCFIGCTLLFKLFYVIFHKNLNLQREAILMSSEILFSVFNMILPHPAIQIAYGNYQLQELATIPNIFQNKYILDPAEMIMTCEKTAWMLFDYQEFVKALPFLTLMDYIATSISLSQFYSLRAKLMKSLCLSMCGQINESLQILLKAIELKNMPLKFVRESEFIKKEQGSNWFAQNKWNYNNSEPFYFDKNKEVIDNLVKLSFPQKLVNQQGSLNSNIFVLAKASLLFKIFEIEVFEKYETNEQRINSLKLIKVDLRELLKQLGIQEELGFLVDEYRLIVQKNSQEITPNNEAQKQKHKVCEDYLISIGITNSTDIEQRIEKGTKEECISYFSQREELIEIMCRTRYLLFQINYAMNYLTRAFYILKKGVDNLIDYADELRQCEQGDEKENDPMEAKAQIAVDLKKKQPVAAAAAKKGGKVVMTDKDKEEQERRIQDQKKAELDQESERLRKIANKREYRRSPNGAWFLRLRTKMCELLLEQNRFEEANEMAERVKQECQSLQDNFYLRMVEEVLARVKVRTGQLETIKAMKCVVELGSRNGQDDEHFGRLMADLAELLVEKQQFALAKDVFEQAVKVFEKRLNELGYEEIVIKWNEKSFKDGVMICEKFLLQNEQESEFLRKADKGKAQQQIGIKGGKNIDPKGAQGVKGKDLGKKVIAQTETNEMKINELYPLANNDFTQEVKETYQQIDIENINNIQRPRNVYMNQIIEPYLTALLRMLQCKLLLAEKNQEKIGSQFIEMLEKIEIILNKNLNLPVSIKLLLNFLYAKCYKKQFIDEIFYLQNTYVKKYIEEKNKKFKRLALRLPYRDLSRNKYMIEIPNFSKILKEELLPLLTQKSKDYLKKCIEILKGETLFFENGLQIEDITMELACVCLLQREYRPRVGYKYINIEEVLQKLNKQKNEKEQQQGDQDYLEKLESAEKLEQLNLELEAYSYMKICMQICEAKIELTEKQTEIAKNMAQPDKVPQDIVNEILEQDYKYKKQYPEDLFDDKKKKVAVNWLDLLTFLHKLARESRIMTFSQPRLKKQIYKLHRYLKQYLPNYQKCISNLTFEIPQKNDSTATFIPEGSFVVRNKYITENREFKFIYILGPVKNEDLTYTGNKEDAEKLLIKQEKDTLYGNLFINESEMTILQQEALNLKSKMAESDKLSKQVRERNYLYHQVDFEKLFESFGKYLTLKEKSKEKSKTKSPDKQENEAQEGGSNIFDKYGIFLPQLGPEKHESIDIFVKLFSNQGLEAKESNNILLLFRHFHHHKYK